MDYQLLNTYFDMSVSELEEISLFPNQPDVIKVTHGQKTYSVTKLVHRLTGIFEVHCVINGADTYIPCITMSEALSLMTVVRD